MLGAYGWAYAKPIRKLYYNLTITAVSVAVALAVGGVEALGLLVGEFHLTGGLWAVSYTHLGEDAEFHPCLMMEYRAQPPLFHEGIRSVHHGQVF